MQPEKRRLTFGTAQSMTHHRSQLERKCQEIARTLSGRTKPLLPKDWTDEDAWKLAGALADLIRQLKLVEHTVFNEENPYPSHDTALEDIRYYAPNAFSEEDIVTPPDFPVEQWKEVLHCGILLAAGGMDFCFPSKGTFADLEELFRGVVRSGGGPVPNFGYLTDWIEAEFTEERCRKLNEQDYDPCPPRFDAPKDPWEETLQAGVYREWQEQTWLRRFPCPDVFLQSVKRVRSFRNEMMGFVNFEIGMENLLCQAIDLYLYQTGASGMAMLDDSFYVAYAMLCRLQKRIEPVSETEGR